METLKQVFRLKGGTIPKRKKKLYLKTYLDFVYTNVEGYREKVKKDVGFKVGIGQEKKNSSTYYIVIEIIGYIKTEQGRWFQVILKEVKQKVKYNFTEDEKVLEVFKEEIKELLENNMDINK